MSGICKTLVIVFGLAWIAALVLLVVGTFGLFGQEQDPLAAVFLVPLGLPWNQFLDRLPEATTLWGAVLAPGVNLILVRVICAIFARSV